MVIPILFYPRAIKKYPMTNQQLGALIRLQSIAHLDPDGAFPLGADLCTLAEWTGTPDEFQLVASCIIPHPTHPGRFTLRQVIDRLDEAARAKQKRKDQKAALIQETVQQLEAKVRKEVRQAEHQSRAEKKAARKPIQQASKLTRYSF